MEPAELGDRFALFVEESGDVGAGVAVFKPEAASSHPAPSPRRSGEVTRWRGRSSAGGTFTNRALTLPEWFDEEWPSSPAGPLSRGSDR